MNQRFCYSRGYGRGSLRLLFEDDKVVVVLLLLLLLLLVTITTIAIVLSHRAAIR